MDNTQVTLTRKELYELVWSVPMVKLADRFGLSDVGLKKKCRKHSIPVPPRGYWARKQAGQNPRQTPLPKGFPLDVTITIYRNPMHENPKQINPHRRRENRVRTQEIEKQVVTSIQSKIRHPLIAQTWETLRACIPDKNNILQCMDQDCLDLKVSPGNLNRALSIMNSVINTLENLGHGVSISKEGTSAQIAGVEIRFRITEELRRRYLEPWEHSLDGYYRFGHSLFSENRVPTGNLRLSIDPPFCLSVRKNWSDTETQRLEDCLTAFIKGLLRIASRQNRKTALNEE